MRAAYREQLHYRGGFEGGGAGFAAPSSWGRTAAFAVRGGRPPRPGLPLGETGKGDQRIAKRTLFPPSTRRFCARGGLFPGPRRLPARCRDAPLELPRYELAEAAPSRPAPGMWPVWTVAGSLARWPHTGGVDPENTGKEQADGRVNGQFPKGVSGNPQGRPRGSLN